MAQASRPSLLERLQLPTQRSEVLGCGYLHKQPGLGGEGVRDRDLRAYALVYLLGGSGYYEDGRLGVRPVAAGDLIVVFPGMRHGYYNGDQRSWSEVWVVFRGPLFAALEVDGLLDRTRPVLHPGRDTALEEAFAHLYLALQGDQLGPDTGLVPRVHQLIADIVRLDRALAQRDDWIDRACTLLAGSLDRPLDCRQVARQLGVGYERFRRGFARALGLAPAQWRQARRIERARRMLQEGTQPLAAIAQALGYCDQYFFNRQFSRATGISPARYRRDFGSRAGDTRRLRRAPPLE